MDLKIPTEGAFINPKLEADQRNLMLSNEILTYNKIQCKALKIEFYQRRFCSFWL